MSYGFIPIVIMVILGSIPSAIGLVTSAYAYDVPEVVDPPSQAVRSLETSESYRFGPIKDQYQEYSDGTIMPSRTFSIEAWNDTTAEWEIIGYSNVHLHKVKIDQTDEFDISIGVTNRINPKVN